MIKLTAIDLDGTLLNPDKKIPDENVKVIQEAARASAKIVLCTGQPKSGLLLYFERPGLVDEEYIIMNNGYGIYNTRNWELVSYAQVSNDESDKLDRMLADYPEACSTLTGEKHHYVVGSGVSESAQHDAGLIFDTAKAVSIDELETSSEIIFQTMYMARAPYLDPFQRAREGALAAESSVVRSQEYIFGTTPKGYTKVMALKVSSEKLGFTPAEVMAIGDTANDIEMLEFADNSVAMGNATNGVETLCRYEAITSDQAGIAQVTYDYVLK